MDQQSYINDNTDEEFHMMDFFMGGNTKHSMNDMEMDLFQSFADSLNSSEYAVSFGSGQIKDAKDSFNSCFDGDVYGGFSCNQSNDELFSLSDYQSNMNFFDFGGPLQPAYQRINSLINIQETAICTKREEFSNPKRNGQQYHSSMTVSSPLDTTATHTIDAIKKARGVTASREKRIENDLFKIDSSKRTKREEQISDSQNNASKDRRRERNKVLARKTRVKKKAEMETLRDSVVALVNENKKLKMIAQKHLPQQVANHLLTSCSVRLPENINQMVHQMMSRTERNLVYDLKLQQRSFCIVNAAANDMPIVYASPAFCELTGYDMQHLVGRNCRLLQGPATDRNEVARIKKALMSGLDVNSVLLNYKKNGKQFWNHIQIHFLRDFSSKSSALLVGVQREVNPNLESQFSRTLHGVSSSSSNSSAGGGGEVVLLPESFKSSQSNFNSTNKTQLALLVEGNTSTRSGSSSASSGSRSSSQQGANSPSQSGSSFGQTDRDEKTSSDGCPSDRRSDND